MIRNYRELNAHSGPFFEHWRRRVVASVGGVLAEDVLREQFGDDGAAPTASSSSA